MYAIHVLHIASYLLCILHSSGYHYYNQCISRSYYAILIITLFHYSITHHILHPIPSLPAPARGRCRKSGGGEDPQGQSGRGRRGEQVPVRYDMHTTATATLLYTYLVYCYMLFIPAYVYNVFQLHYTIIFIVRVMLCLH